MKGLVHNHWTNTSRIWIHVLFRPRDSALRFSALIKMHYFTTLLRCDTIFQQFPNAMTGSKKVKFTVAQQTKIQCLKITQKIAFNIASEASYVYILSGQKFMKNAENGQFWRVFEKLEACGQTVLPDRSILIGQKLVKNTKIEKVKCDIFCNFQTQ